MNNEELLVALGRLEGKVDSLIATQRAQNETLNTHDKRIRMLENSRSLMMGAAAVIGALSAKLLSLLGLDQ